MKRKILFIIDSLNCGGAEKSLVSLLPLIDRSRFEVYLWIRHRGGVFESLLTDDTILVNAPCYSLSEKVFMRIGGLAYSLMYRLNRVIGKKEHPAETLWKCQGWAMKRPEGEWDTVVAYQQGVPTYLVATKLKDARRLAWVNANIFEAGYNAEYNAKMYAKMDGICPVSEELQTIMRDKYPQFLSKYTTIYDIINPQIIRQQAEDTIPEKEYNATTTTILTVGRLAGPKNYILAVETARVMREQDIDFCWYFIGEGDERQKIVDLIEKYQLGSHVKLLGLRMNPYAYMKHCDIYVQTSRFEGFGLTIAEAKILGKPIVSTNFDVVYDQLKHEENGLIANMTPESLAECIIRLMTDKNLKKRIIENVKSEENNTYVTEVAKIHKLLVSE